MNGLFNDKTISIEKMTQYYNPRYWIYLRSLFKLNVNETELASLKRLWLGSITSYPFEYLRHRWSVFREMIGYTPEKNPQLHPNHRLPWSRVLMDPHPPRNLGGPKEVAKRIRHDYKLSSIQEHIKKNLDHLSLGIIFRPYIYIILGTICMVAGLFVIRRNLGIVFFLALSGLLYEATFFFGTGSPDYRYSHWMVFSSWMSFLILLMWLVEWRLFGKTEGRYK